MTRKSVHILGAGGIGSLVSSRLAQSKNHKFNINFILRSEFKVNKLREEFKHTVSIVQRFNDNHVVDFKIDGCITADELVSQKSKLEYLIVTVKTFDTLKSIKPLISVIDPEMTKIILIQNGMGVLEELYSDLWPDLSTRPKNIYQGVISHGVFQDDKINPFKFVHAGNADFKIARLPFQLPEENKLNDTINDSVIEQDFNKMMEHDKEDEIIESLCEYDPTFNGKHLSYPDLLIYQIEKLMVNLCINPITSILNCINGELNNLQTTRDLFNKVIQEAMQILEMKYSLIFKQSQILHDEKFNDAEKLLDYVIDCGTVINRNNSSSMRQDVLNLRSIEIDYINGYIVKLGKEMNMNHDVNSIIVLLAKSRLEIERNRSIEK